MKICFLINKHNSSLFFKIAKLFLENKQEVCFIGLEKSDEQRISEFFGQVGICKATTYMEKNWEHIDVTQLDELQRRYSRLSLWDIYYSDRWLIKQNREDAPKFIVGYIKMFEEFYRREKPDIVLYELVSNFTAFMAEYIGESFNVKFFSYASCRFEDYNKSLILNGELGTFERANKIYLSDYKFTEDEIEKAKFFLESIVQRGRQSEGVLLMSKNVKFYEAILSIAKGIVRLCQPEWRNKNKYKYDYITYKCILDYFEPFKMYIRGKLVGRYYKKVDFNYKYFLFPLHFQPEASTLVCARKYCNQLFFIDSLAKALPAGTILYVKEHIVFPGHKKLEFYKELEKYPNVKLVKPTENIFSMIKNSLGVISLTNTTGIEAIALDKPIFVAGNVFYDIIKGVTKVTDVYEEREKFLNLIPVSEEEKLRYFASYILARDEFLGTDIFDMYDGSNNNVVRFDSDLNANGMYKSIIKTYDELNMSNAEQCNENTSN